MHIPCFPRLNTYLSSSHEQPAPARSAPPPAAPATKNSAVAPAAPQQSAGGGFLSTMVQGFAFGTGSSIAREAVGSVLGSGQQQPQQAIDVPMQNQQPAYRAAPTQGPCAFDNEALMNCLKANASNASSCEFYFNALQQCQSANN